MEDGCLFGSRAVKFSNAMSSKLQTTQFNHKKNTKCLHNPGSVHIDCVRYFGDAVGNEAVENIFRLHLGAVHSTVQDRHISVAIVFCCVHIDLVIIRWHFLNVAPRLCTTEQKATVFHEK